MGFSPYHIHRSKEIYGEDADEFRPERWFECDSVGVSKAFSPFSVGPRYVISAIEQGSRLSSYHHRACVGRNLANFELQIIIASILKRYHFVLENPDEVVGADVFLACVLLTLGLA